MDTRVDGDEWRRARRAFLRAHHPDVGGDPEVFVAGLARFDAPVVRHGPTRPVVVVRRPRGVSGWCRHVVGAARRRARPSTARVR